MPVTATRRRWVVSPRTEADEAQAVDLARRLAVQPLVGRVLWARGLGEEAAARAFLTPRLADLSDPNLLPGSEEAARRMLQAVAQGQPIVIYGDYDVDGITASAVLWHTLRMCGGRVGTYVPHRIEEGYGLNCEAIRAIAAGQAGLDGGGDAAASAPAQTGGKPLIVSVDCGITAVEPATVARDLGVDLIITDHHDFDANRLPPAQVLVHPGLAQGDAAATLAGLCGAGVAFKLAWQLARLHCGSDRVSAEFRGLLLDLLSLAALGTVADVVPLRGENRVIAAHGLGHIKQTRFAGLNALIDATKLREERIDAYHVGFVLGPRLNACGRMGHAREALQLLTSAQGPGAARLAEFLSAENERRRATERAIFAEARQMVLDQGMDRDDCRAIVLGKAGWHAGVVGIVCSRLVEAFGRPVVLLAIDEESGEAAGSARSVDGFSIYDAFANASRFLTSFGGHAMAAGLRLPSGSVGGFRKAMVEYANARLAAADLVRPLVIDAECSLGDIRVETFEQLGWLAPFGRGNSSPVLCVRGATLAQPPRPVGAGGRHVQLMLRQNRSLCQAIWFGGAEAAAGMAVGDAMDVAFEPRVSVWHGRKRFEIQVIDAFSPGGPHERP